MRKVVVEKPARDGTINVMFALRISDRDEEAEILRYFSPDEAAEVSAAWVKRPVSFGNRLADLTDDVLYGQVCASPELSQRDRSLVTVSALIALNRPDQLRSHLGRARANGLTQEELIGAITHLAFYAGWPNAVTAVSVAREVFREN